MKSVRSELKFVMAMFIFGSVGIFVKSINLPSMEIVLLRTIIGSCFLAIIFMFRKQSINFKAIMQNLPMLITAGVVLGGGWVFLFQAYKYTSISTATLLYYFAPIVVFLLSPFIFKEKMSLSKIVGIIAAIVGMLIVNGIGNEGNSLSFGIICGLISAVLYALLMIANKFIKNLSGLESTFVQLLVAAFVMTIYVLIGNSSTLRMPMGLDLILVIIVGVLHTGIACYLYFSSLQELPGQTIAIMSYIDPASALIFSFIFLQERLSLLQTIGALLILGGTAFSQLYKANVGVRVKEEI